MSTYISTAAEKVTGALAIVRVEILDGRYKTNLEPDRSILALLQRAQWALERAQGHLDEAMELSKGIEP